MQTNRQPRGGSFTAEVSLSDQKRLNTLFAHEREMYNSIIDVFESRTRSMPQTILNINAQVRKLMVEVSALGMDWKKLGHTPDAWPPQLKKSCELMLKQGKLQLDGQHNLMMQELSRRNWSVLPNTKRMMLNTMIDFYQEQAQIFAEPQRSDVMEVSYRVPPSNLSRMDDRLKRHAQVPRTDVQIKWVPEQEVSYVETPLNLEPLRVPGVNLNNLRDWNIMLLRQESGKWVDYQTPWLVEMRQSNGKYLLKAIDIGSRRTTQ
jgi:hypothetical protein